MNIVLAIDQYDIGNNGTTMSSRNLVNALREKGHNVRILGMGTEGEDKFVLPELHIPLATPIAHSQGMAFAKPVEETIRAALKGADVVHFYMPFLPLAVKTKKIAEEMGIATTAAFHVQPENITYNCGLSRSKAAPERIYEYFKKHYYEGYKHVHCPSKFIASELKRHNYSAKLHVISNGVDNCFTYTKNEKPEELKDKFSILMIGRLSKEKRQDLLIEAAALSKYSDKIQLFFAGKGPKASKYEKLGEKLKNKPDFSFYTKEELKYKMSTCDLYVHPADVEIEAISCIEAFSTGLVPVISASDKSATGQFALDDRSLFKPGDAQDLANKIDYWIEHPVEREQMGHAYSKHGEQFRLSHCATMMEEMFYEAIEDQKKCTVVSPAVSQAESEPIDLVDDRNSVKVAG